MSDNVEIIEIHRIKKLNLFPNVLQAFIIIG